MDELLEQPENHKVEPNGSILYGCEFGATALSSGRVPYIFPFTYIWGLIADIIHPDYGTRGDAWVRFFESSVGEIVLLLIFGLIVCGAAIIFCKLTGIGLA